MESSIPTTIWNLVDPQNDIRTDENEIKIASAFTTVVQLQLFFQMKGCIKIYWHILKYVLTLGFKSQKKYENDQFLFSKSLLNLPLD